MRYGVVLGLAVRHTFYTGGSCPDFVIRPSSETTRRLRNHRLILRSAADGVRVATPLDGEGNPFLPLPEDAAFVFHLELRNSDFALLTDLTAVAAQSAPDGSFTVRYPVQPGLATAAFAEVEIRGAGSVAAPRELEVLFQAKRARWTYYCITDPSANGGVLTIVDAVPSTAEPLLFSEANTRELGEEPDPTDPVALRLAEAYPGKRRIRFISDDLVACRQAPRKHLELQLDGVRVSGPLPNPSVRSHSRIQVPVTGTLEEQDSLFQVVKYPTQPGE
ncbi:MAG: hypothetical protein GY856_42550 [bacterium]|nr:hypothetical protein [bacterium]